MRIAVYCGSSRRSPTPCVELAREVGEAIGRAGHELVYGGGNTGLMGAVADGALAAGARVTGVILERWVDGGVAHTGLHALHRVDDMRSRKAGLDDGADGFIALPGGLGTFEEVAEILSFRKIGLHDRPLVFLNHEGYFDPLFALLQAAIDAGFDDPEVSGYYAIASKPSEAVARVEAGAS